MAKAPLSAPSILFWTVRSLINDQRRQLLIANWLLAMLAN
jgi:hypothetical protein